jgi:biopolymer transport protein ExbD
MGEHLMADKRRFLDIWIVESNTVYKEVPFAVVTDWVQQGRLLEEDMFKPSGTKDWIKLGGWGEFRPYFPKPEPHRTEDQAEALEAVHVDFTFKRPKDEEEDDVDMIPLIDVSLVLLVFFMLTATGASLAAFVQTPQVAYGQEVDKPESLRIDIANDNGQPIYSLGVGTKPPEEDEKDFRNLGAMLDRLKARLAQTPTVVEVVINADKDLKAKVVRDVLVALRAEPFRHKIRGNYYGASRKREE